MSVYVDHLKAVKPTERWPYSTACHLFCDIGDEAAMHAMAERLELLLGWFQNDSRLPHYDLTQNKREEALRLGAVDAGFHTLASKMKERNP